VGDIVGSPEGKWEYTTARRERGRSAKTYTQEALMGEQGKACYIAILGLLSRALQVRLRQPPCSRDNYGYPDVGIFVGV
jgi:hypothetical protein